MKAEWRLNMRILKHICLLTIGLIIFTILLSCSEAKQEASSNLSENQIMRISNSNTNQFNLAEFERNRELWTSENIQNYKMIIGASGFLTNFPEEVLTEVKNRQAKSIESLSKTGRNHTEAYKNYDTVEKLFGFIEKEAKSNAHKLDVKYSETLGYPISIFVDEHSGSDDKLSLSVKNLEIIK